MKRSGLNSDTPLQLPDTDRRQYQPFGALQGADSGLGGLLLDILCTPRASGLLHRFEFRGGIRRADVAKSKPAPGQAGNTPVQVWTIAEGFGIGSEFRQTCVAANFRDHEVVLFR